MHVVTFKNLLCCTLSTFNTYTSFNSGINCVLADNTTSKCE